MRWARFPLSKSHAPELNILHLSLFPDCGRSRGSHSRHRHRPIGTWQGRHFQSITSAGTGSCWEARWCRGQTWHRGDVGLAIFHEDGIELGQSLAEILLRLGSSNSEPSDRCRGMKRQGIMKVSSSQYVHANIFTSILHNVRQNQSRNPFDWLIGVSSPFNSLVDTPSTQLTQSFR